MGFPIGYSELLIPKLIINTACLLGFIRTAICWLLRSVGLGEFLEPESSWPEHSDHFQVFSSVSAQRIRERLPVVTFGILADRFEGAEEVTCAVCLNEFQTHEEIRRLTNCCHIFHKGCLDKWLDLDHNTCPLCRSLFLPEGIEREMDEELWTAESISNLFGGVSSVPS